LGAGFYCAQLYTNILNSNSMNLLYNKSIPCFGNGTANNTFSFKVVGGAATYTYVFDGTATAQTTFNNLAIGNHTLVVPWLPEAARSKDANGWLQLGRQLDGIGRRCRDAGMRLLYHNHAFEMIEIEGQLAIDWLLEAAAPENVGFEIDLAWVQRGGQNGVQLLEKYAGRCPRIHCKDLAPEGENQDQMGFADVGHGVLDWGALLPAAKAAGAEWYIVEHDLPKEPLVSIGRSFTFLQQALT
jgi:sugar phosphate isomerase/epimerase